MPDVIDIVDRLPVEGLKRDSTGNVIGVAKAARTGIQFYNGYELGKPELAKVAVYRPPEEVFSRDSMRTYASLPVTIEHPGENVTPDNWKDHAIGETSADEIVRDGEMIRVPFMVRDAQGQEELSRRQGVSMGYRAEIDFTPGVVPDGQNDAGKQYDAVCRAMRMNHLAIVASPRGGPELRIGDSEGSDTVATKIIMVDGLQVEVTEAAEKAITKLQDANKALADQLGEANTKLTAAETAKGEAEGKVATLEQAVKDATNPENLAKAAKERATLVDQAKKLVPALVTDNLDDAAIRKAVVDAKLGDTGKAMTDAANINGAFNSLVALMPADKGNAGSTVKDSVTAVIIDGTVADLDDATTARDKARKSRLDRFNRREPAKAEA